VLAMTGQTAGPNWLIFFVKKDKAKKLDFKLYFSFQN